VKDKRATAGQGLTVASSYAKGSRGDDRRSVRPDAKITTPWREQSDLALVISLWHVHSNRNGRYTE